MAATPRVRNPEWQNNEDLKEDLQRYVCQNLSRKEILDFVSRDYDEYAWSMCTLSRRLRFFDIKYVEYSTPVNEVEDAVRKEMEGPGQFLGYRAMHRKIREQHGLAVPRNLVYTVMTKVDPEGLQRRGNVGQKKRRRGATGTFTSLGPNHTHSADGHDKLMGFAKSTFPLAVYGLQDTFSGCILYLKLWTSNSNPKLIGRWYLQYLYKCKVVSKNLRLDKGNETGTMATIHGFLRQLHGTHDDSGCDSVRYGPSTSNKIERWWRELHNRFEKFFKRQLMMLLEKGYYEPDNQLHRHLLAFIYIPIIQKEMEIFRTTIWNTHRVRCQKDAQVPKGIPIHLYNFPEKYDAEECGVRVTIEDIDETTTLSGVDIEEDYLPSPVRTRCENVIPNVDSIKPDDAAVSYLFLKAHYTEQPNSG